MKKTHTILLVTCLSTVLISPSLSAHWLQKNEPRSQDQTIGAGLNLPGSPGVVLVDGAGLIRLEEAENRGYMVPADPYGIAAEARLGALEKMKKMEANRAARADTSNGLPIWFPIGPAPSSGGQTYGCSDCRVDVSGRATVIAVNPFNPDDVFLGTAAGGVWHTPTGGHSWKPLSDDQASPAIGAIALDNCNGNGCDTIYAGTGENNIRRDTYYGAGLLVGQVKGSGVSLTVDWNLRGHSLFNMGSINNVVLDPTTSGQTKRLYVTLSSGVTASATESTITAPEPPMGYGIYKSEDQGVSWTTLVVPGAAGAKPTDLEMDPQDSNVLYAGFMGKGVFRGTRNPADGTITWCPLNPGIPLPSGCAPANGLPDPTATTFDHVEISIHRPNLFQAATLYALFGNCANPILSSCTPSIYKSTDGGNSWTLKKFGGPPSYSRYTHILTIHPANPSTVFFGGLRLHKSTDSGETFTQTGSDSLHPDHQAVVFADPTGCASDPAKCNRMYDASDGGFALSTDGGVTWESGNDGLQITGFQSITSSPLTDRVIGGAQDNGTNMWLGSNIWEHRDDGDAASTIMDLDSASVMYDVYLEVAPRRSRTGGTCCSWPNITNGLDTSDPSAFYPPFVQDPTPSPGAPDPSLFPDYHRLYFGTNRLYRSALPPGQDTLSWRPGNSWNPVSPVLGEVLDSEGNPVIFPDIRQPNVITAIAVAPSNPNRIYVGYYDGQIFRSNAGGPCEQVGCWTDLTNPPLPAAVVTRIAVPPTDADTAYATFSGFDLPGCAHVYKTTNGGASWFPASGPNPCDPNDVQSLPDIPANTISIEPSNPDRLWLGTDIGVFKSLDGGASWGPFNGFGNTRLPNVPVYEISIDEQHDRVIAATHGRGAFIHSPNAIPGIDIHEVACRPPCLFDLFLFVNSVINPPDEAFTIQLIQAEGNIFAESRLDAQGGIVTAGANGQLVTSRPGFLSNRPGLWASFNGMAIGGRDLGEFDEPDNPITAVAISSGKQRTVKQLGGPAPQNNPPSTTFDLSGLENAGKGRTTQSGQGTDPLQEGVFNLVASVQAGDGSSRSLCEVGVPFRAGDSVEDVLLRARDALNSDRRCEASTLRAEVQGLLSPGQPPSEDLPIRNNPRLVLSGPRVNGIQLITSLRVEPGRAMGLCFDVDSLGVPVRNTLMPMRLTFETSRTGAGGGEITLIERSPLGSCSITVPTARGASAERVAASLAAAFQARGIPGPNPGCPARHNPRDVVLDGDAVTAVLASELVICINDPGLGFSLEPEELQPPPTQANLYVSSFGTDDVKQYNGVTGAFLSTFASGGGLGDPFGLAFGPDGNLYVSSHATNSVMRYNGQTGAFIDTFVPTGSGGLRDPEALVFGPDGNLYVSSFSTHDVKRYNGMTGAFMDSFAHVGDLAVVPIGPTGLIFGPDGNLYVCSSVSNGILRFDAMTGKFLGTFVSGGGLSSPQDVAFGPDGNLYVSSFFTHDVKRYNGQTGAFMDAFVPVASGGLINPVGLVFGADGNLYVSSFFTHEVKRYNGQTGAFMGNFTSGGGLSNPTFLIFR